MVPSLLGRRFHRLLAALAVPALTTACGGGGAGGGTANDTPVAQRAPMDAATNSDPGALAARFLRDGAYTTLLVEVDHPAGRAPEPQALDALAARLQAFCAKPDGVTVLLDDAIPAEAFPPALDAESLEDLEAAWRDAYSDAATGVVVLYVLCVPGGHVDDTTTQRALGMAFGGSSAALFLDSTDRGADVFATTAEMRAMVLIHESSHVLGLVNHGVPMATPHEDADHPNHCDDPACLLSEAPVLPRLGPAIDDPAFAPLCERCLSDVATFSGR